MNKKRARRTFIKTLFISFFSFLAFIICGLFVLVYFLPAPNDSEHQFFKSARQGKEALEDLVKTSPKRINFLVLGVDKGATRTDTIMTGSFLPKDEKVYLLSVPRDTMVTLTDTQIESVKQRISGVPRDGVVKLNEVYHYAGKDDGILFVMDHVERLLGVKFDFYLLIDTDGFAVLVDEIGGVEFDVPIRMRYNDPVQGLKINLDQGLQTLNGKQAEGLVRFRSGYARADIDRMATQQKFMKVLIKKALKPGNIKPVFETLLKYTKTNFSAVDAAKYARFADKINTESIETFTLPTTGVSKRGKSFQKVDETKSQEIINKIFFDEIENGVSKKSSKGKKIIVLNGGNRAGTASKTKKVLEENGFTVSSIGDSNEEKRTRTRIIVKHDGEGADLLEFFEDAEVVVDENFSDTADITIIIGLIEN